MLGLLKRPQLVKESLKQRNQKKGQTELVKQKQTAKIRDIASKV